jgi:uncharacterized protein (DUF952 family)
MIYHITTRAAWEAAQHSGFYTADSLAQEGFIHASTVHQVLRVADAFYRHVPDCVLLCIDPARLTAPLRLEPPIHPQPEAPLPTAAQELFPHLYGRLNVEAVTQVLPFAPGADGRYTLPDDLRE